MRRYSLLSSEIHSKGHIKAVVCAAADVSVAGPLPPANPAPIFKRLERRKSQVLDFAVARAANIYLKWRVVVQHTFSPSIFAMASTPASISCTALDAESKSSGVDVQVHKEVASDGQPSYGSLRFQMIFVSVCVSIFLSALEFVSRRRRITCAYLLTLPADICLHRTPYDNPRLERRRLRMDSFVVRSRLRRAPTSKRRLRRGE